MFPMISMNFLSIDANYTIDTAKKEFYHLGMASQRGNRKEKILIAGLQKSQVDVRR